jgi:hypothetical protein
MANLYAGRDPATFPVSKSVFIAVDERPAVARRELERWFTEVYHNPPETDASGIHGTPKQVRAAQGIGGGRRQSLALEPDLPPR